MSTDRFQAHDYYMMDDMLTEEHKLIRDTARAWVKKEVSPIIEEYYENNEGKVETDWLAEVIEKSTKQYIEELNMSKSEKLDVYLADTEPRKMRGLMWESQDFLANDKGMLFVFDEPGTRSMWMKNMQFPLDILWFDENGNIVSIEKNVPPCITPLEVMSCKSVGVSADNAQYVLELTAGYVDKYDVTENSQLQLISI